MPYRTLVVAPTHPDLEYASDEVMSVVNSLDAKLLQGKRAILHSLIDMLNQGWDIVWLSTHGSEQGVYLNDGIVNTSELTTLIRSAGARLTVFNTCSSYPVAYAIRDEVRCDFVATILPIPDRSAFVTGAVFANQVANGMDFYDAYEIAKPGQNSTYVFLGAKGPVMPPYERNRAESPIPSGNESALARLEQTVARLAEKIKGDEWGGEGLLRSSQRVERELALARQDIAELKRNWTWVRWAIIVLIIAVIIIGGAQVLSLAGVWGNVG